jgi:hypothetical protein
MNSVLTHGHSQVPGRRARGCWAYSRGSLDLCTNISTTLAVLARAVLGTNNTGSVLPVVEYKPSSDYVHLLILFECSFFPTCGDYGTTEILASNIKHTCPQYDVQ